MISSPNNLTLEFPIQLDEFYLDLQEDGRKISILDKAKVQARPFPGLRPFKTSEFQLFKGRDGQAEELIKRLRKNHFLAVIGSSGTGKSSLVRAGLIPQLFGGYLPEAGNKWNIAVCRPGKDPVENLAIALSGIKDQTQDKAHIFENYQSIAPLLESSIYGILETDELLNSDRPADSRQNLLIIIDQFEELFRFDRKDLGKSNIENHFVNLLLKASRNSNSSVYVIITMRSEFLGDCVKFRGLPEAINEGQYLVPQLSRNQLKEVIEGPINLAGRKIAPGLVELLVNEIEESKLKENLDQLPILQHALMRTYQEAVSEGPDTVIEYRHYAKIGEMEKALANHAESKFSQLAEGNSDVYSKKQEIAKIIFQALTDATADQKGGRRPTELKNIYSIAASIRAGEKEVDEVVNHFRDVDTSFIMPPMNPELRNTGLYPDLMMDISHESLMRNWERLNKWLGEEVRLAKLYSTLNERRELHENDSSELVRGALLKELTDWRASYANNITWTKRYHHLPKQVRDISIHEDLYRRNLAFLELSEKTAVEARHAEQRKLKAEIESAQKEEFRRKVIWFFAASTVLSLSLGLWAFTERGNAKKSAAYAHAQAVLARQQESRALESEKVSLEQSRLARESEQDAMEQRDSVVLFATKIQALKVLAERSRQEALNQSKLANIQKEEALLQSHKRELQLVKSEVQKENFYSSNLLDPDFKEDIVHALFTTSLSTPDKIALEKYIDIDLLHDINDAVAARERILTEPIVGLRKAAEVWRHVKDSSSDHPQKEIIQNILLDIFRRNIFFTQEIKPGSSLPSRIAIAKNKSRFAIDNLNAITLGNYSNDSLKIDHRFTNRLFDDSVNNYYSRSVVVTLTFSDTNKILSLQNNGRIIEWADKVKTEIGSIPGVNNAILADFSPDANYVVVASKEENSMKVWNLPQGGNGLPVLSFNDTTAANRFIKQVRFSPNSRRVIKLYNNGRMEVWSVPDRKRLSQFDSYKYITAANFTPDGKYLVAAASTNSISLFDSSGRELNSTYLPSLIKGNSDYTFSVITDLALREGWKEMMISQQGGDVFVASRPDGDSLLQLTAAGTRPQYSINIKKLNGAVGGIRTAVFLNQSNMVTISGNGSLHYWDSKKKFESVNDAFASVAKLVAKNYSERLQDGEITFDDVKKDSNKNNIRNAALYYYGGIYNTDSLTQARNINQSLYLYEKLSESDQGTQKSDDLDKITRLLERSNNIERSDPKGNARSILRRLEKIVPIREEQRRTDSLNTVLARNLANNYNDLAYYNLFAADFENAILYAKKGLNVDSGHIIIYTNLALAYLLSGREQLAESIYRKYKDGEITSISKTFKAGFIEDFDDFTKAGIIKPNDKRVLRIRKMLAEE
jgi:WD40 repeat protein